MTTEQLLQFLWITLITAGLLIEVWALSEAWRDRTSLRIRKANGVQRILADATIRRELVRIVQLWIFLGIGLLAVTTPNSQGTQWFGIVGLFTVGALVSIAGLLDAIDRRRIMR